MESNRSSNQQLWQIIEDYAVHQRPACRDLPATETEFCYCGLTAALARARRAVETSKPPCPVCKAEWELCMWHDQYCDYVPPAGEDGHCGGGLSQKADYRNWPREAPHCPSCSCGLPEKTVPPHKHQWVGSEQYSHCGICHIERPDQSAQQEAWEQPGECTYPICGCKGKKDCKRAASPRGAEHG